MRIVQVIPSGLVITRFPVPLSLTATNKPLPYVTDCHQLSAAGVRAVQVIPSGLVITPFPVPVSLTATNKPLPYVTEVQPLSAAEFRLVQVIPSGLVITRFPVPLPLTATNKPLPYVTEYQKLSAAEVRLVQVIPSGLVITRLPVPVPLTATNKPLPYVTSYHWLSAADVRVVQVIPSAKAWDTTLTLNNDARITVAIFLLFTSVPNILFPRSNPWSSPLMTWGSLMYGSSGFGLKCLKKTVNGAREGIRTPNLLIRSQMLYPLSYARLFSCETQYYPLFLLDPNATRLAIYVAFL